MRPRIICAMTDRDVIDRLQAVTGMGRISLGRKTAPQHKTYWSWVVSRDRDAISLMKTVYPHMGERRSAKIEEILIGWRTSEIKPRRNRRESPRRVNRD